MGTPRRDAAHSIGSNCETAEESSEKTGAIEITNTGTKNSTPITVAVAMIQM